MYWVYWAPGHRCCSPGAKRVLDCEADSQAIVQRAQNLSDPEAENGDLRLLELMRSRTMLRLWEKLCRAGLRSLHGCDEFSGWDQRGWY